MDLKEIKSELRKLSELVGGWSGQRPVSQLEHDLVLEKLRAVYEALRFGPEVTGGRFHAYIPAAATAPERPVQGRPRRRARPMAEESAIEMVDLSEVLSLDDSAEPEYPAASPKAAGSGSVSSGFMASAESAGPFYADSDDGDPEIIEFDDEPDPVPVPRPAPRRKPVTYPAPEAAEEPVADPVAEAVPEAAPVRPVSAPAPEVPQPSEQEQPEEKPQAVEPQSLFGPDEEALRHRHKQRVIMSLYDSEPKPSEAAAERPAPSAPKPAARIDSAALRETETDDEFRTDDTGMVLLDALTEQPVGAAPEPEEPEGPEILELDDEPVPAAPAAPPAPAAPRKPEAPAAEPAGQVLGEVINHDVRTLGQTMAAPNKSFAAPITDLRQAIGINDKFLMIRDLFGGNSVLFDATITAPNNQRSLDDCMIYIAEHFAWNPDSESARLVIELLERKFA